MTVDEAIQKYIERFGGFPSESLGRATDDYIIEVVEEALRTGKEPDLNDEEEVY